MGQSRSGKARPRRGVPNLDPNGQSLKNEAEAIAKAKVMAIGVSLDKPEVDPMRRIVIRDDGGQEIFNEPVYSTPMAR